MVGRDDDDGRLRRQVAHHVRGQKGACINLHGHTWKFEVGLEAEVLDNEGCVVDFSKLKATVLNRCHALLDHSLAVGEATYRDIADSLEPLGVQLLASRKAVHDEPIPTDCTVVKLGTAENRYPGGMKVTVFPFSPTSERLAEWLFNTTVAELEDERVKVTFARIYETLHPVESVAEYRRS